MNFRGRPIEVRLLPSLRASGGRLLHGDGPGTPVHAGSFLRERLMVLDSALWSDAAERRRILAHEIFHFTWVRLGNGVRAGWERVLAAELRAGVSGELGWSSELRKQALTVLDRRTRSRRWREYACESFCDTAAWLYGGSPRHPEFTLPAGPRKLRRQWFQRSLDEDAVPI